MNPQDLLKKTILNESSKTGSDFKDIIHRGNTLKAKIEYGDFRKSEQSKDTIKSGYIQDEISFLNVSTAIGVQRGDKVTLDNIDYYIEHYSLVMSDMYNIFAVKKVQTGGMF